MHRFQSKLNTGSEQYKTYQAHNLKLVSEFRQRQEKARHQRPERDLNRLAKKNKLRVYERLELLLDPGTPFLELSTLAANMAYDGAAPLASIVTGIGIVSGREVVVHADDSSTKAGAWYPLSGKKVIRALDIAIENRLPMIHLCDSAGALLQYQEGYAERYDGAGRIFRNQSILSKMGVPQLSVVMGHCTAGGGYIPGLSEYSVILRGNGGIFLGGPPLVKAATGEDLTADEIGGADLHTQISGTSDYAANSEQEAIAIGREIVGQWQQPEKAQHACQTPELPYYDPKELYGIIPNDIKVQFDMCEVIARIVDGSRFHEYQPDYGTTMVCGYAHIWGYRIGILANNGILFNDSTLKATHFMKLCNQNKTPLLFLQNTTGYMIGREYEMNGITKNGAKMIMTMTNIDVPKFTIMCNGSFGAGTYGMCGRAYDGRFLFSWPNHQISLMGAEQAAKTLVDIKATQLKREGGEVSKKMLEEIQQRVVEEYADKSSAYYSTSQIWDDGIIDPADTRNTLGIAISAAMNAPISTVKNDEVLRL
jgi:3-methylcrotonyl-CoA carboxylase beta subunit